MHCGTDVRSKAAATLLVVVLILGPQNVPEQCDQIVFERANPGLCTASGGPFGQFPNGGTGGGDGGLLGGLGRIVHRLTGGLL